VSAIAIDADVEVIGLLPASVRGRDGSYRLGAWKGRGAKTTWTPRRPVEVIEVDAYEVLLADTGDAA